MSFSEAVVTVLKRKYAKFSGRARRSEYWWFCLASILINAVATIVLALGLVAGQEFPAAIVVAGIIYAVVYFGLILPSLAVAVRRLHDIGRTGWWMLLSLVPFGALVLIVFAVLEGEQGTNKWGPNPKNADPAYGQPDFVQ
ncbi:DUF805 domain-containing protein [Kineosporia babensis]|uniref:DUF805 domain-containing protein n=1 Tax=Kineosporia babensis TaxID=499548 RepID=A0A9X1NE24_9ACTN|nr:DUF805 domain-containing protein [Kineosporia babensis]